MCPDCRAQSTSAAMRCAGSLRNPRNALRHPTKCLPEGIVLHHLHGSPAHSGRPFTGRWSLDGLRVERPDDRRRCDPIVHLEFQGIHVHPNESAEYGEGADPLPTPLVLCPPRRYSTPPHKRMPLSKIKCQSPANKHAPRGNAATHPRSQPRNPRWAATGRGPSPKATSNAIARPRHNSRGSQGEKTKRAKSAEGR